MKVLGKVSKEEVEEIKELFKIKNSLYEINSCINRCEELEIGEMREVLTEQIQKDMEDISLKLIVWWKKIAEKYHWEYQEGEQWRINYLTKEVFLL